MQDLQRSLEKEKQKSAKKLAVDYSLNSKSARTPSFNSNSSTIFLNENMDSMCKPLSSSSDASLEKSMSESSRKRKAHPYSLMQALEKETANEDTISSPRLMKKKKTQPTILPIAEQ